MKIATRCAAAIALLLATIGCEQTTVEGTGGKKLTLSQPSSQTLKRGETNQISISISRTSFSNPVEVKFSNLPKGVHVIEDKKIGVDQNSGTFTLHAAPDADLVSNHVVKVTVEGPDNMTATETFQITVKDKN